MTYTRLIFLLCTIVACFPAVNAAMALALGIILGGVGYSPAQVFGNAAAKWGSTLLRWSVVGLGFGINLLVLLQTGQHIFLSTTVFVGGALAAGYLLAKIYRIDAPIATLVSVGTAICGGSAIATISAVLKSDNQQISIATAIVFLLNAAALFVFPAVGQYMELSQQQFGEWAAIAIHDTSSVVGAAAKYGDQALQIATVTKMVRVLWIIPIALFFAYRQQKQQSQKNAIDFPYFIVGFLATSLIFTAATHFLPTSQVFFKGCYAIAKQALVVSLLFIGASISFEKLKKVGFSVFLYAISLWLLVSILSLLFVLFKN